LGLKTLWFNNGSNASLQLLEFLDSPQFPKANVGVILLANFSLNVDDFEVHPTIKGSMNLMRYFLSFTFLKLMTQNCIMLVDATIEQANTIRFRLRMFLMNGESSKAMKLKDL
jgi:hypothetical protein